MRISYGLMICLCALSVVIALEGDYLLKANLKSLDASVCVDELKNKIKLIESLNNDLTSNNYKRVLDKMGDIIFYFNETIPKCADQFCWMSGQERCEYIAETACEQINSLWYPKCKSGYKIKESSICVQECPTPFKESGLYCEKPDNYFRGLGYPWKFGDRFGTLDGPRDRCKRENSQGCEQVGAIIYPNCQANYHSSGCCSCQPDCPAEMKDNGVTCLRKQYARGFGQSSGQCIRDSWNEFTAITEFGECTDQITQLKTEITGLLEKLNMEQDKTMWDTLKQAYVLVKHTAPFVEQCSQTVIALDNNTDDDSKNTEEPSYNMWTTIFEIFFKLLQMIVDFFKKE